MACMFLLPGCILSEYSSWSLFFSVHLIMVTSIRCSSRSLLTRVHPWGCHKRHSLLTAPVWLCHMWFYVYFTITWNRNVAGLVIGKW
jgi:hypothetical protein